MKVSKETIISITPMIFGLICFIIGRLTDDLNYDIGGLAFVMLGIVFYFASLTNAQECRIQDCRLEIEELMEEVNALKKAQK